MSEDNSSMFRVTVVLNVQPSCPGQITSLSELLYWQRHIPPLESGPLFTHIHLHTHTQKSTFMSWQIKPNLLLFTFFFQLNWHQIEFCMMRSQSIGKLWITIQSWFNLLRFRGKKYLLAPVIYVVMAFLIWQLSLYSYTIDLNLGTIMLNENKTFNT